MKIASVECLSAHAGWRIYDFLKVATTDGLVGWSEFSRAFNGPGVPETIAAIAPRLLGDDPSGVRVTTMLREAARPSRLAYQACSAIANALLDVRARALGVPVYELLGGHRRERVPVYWAHCGTYRASHAEIMQKPPLRSLDDVVSLGREVAGRGYTALKANLLVFDGDRATRYTAAATRTRQPPARALGEQLTALRAGAGPHVDLMLDLGSNFRAEAALLAMARVGEGFGLRWLEVELDEPGALRAVRERTGVPMASGERLRASEYQALLCAGSVDVPIVDVLFNGVANALQVATECAAFDATVAVHNCYSPLATMIAAAYCAVVPNLNILELDVDGVPWQDDFVSCPPRIAGGYLAIPAGPGWGTEVNEAAVREHPVS